MGTCVIGTRLIHVGGSVSYPLSPTVHRDAQMKFEFDHFKRGRMSVSHQVADHATVIAGFLRAFSVTHTCCFDNSPVVSHVIVKSHKTIVKTLDQVAPVSAHTPASLGFCEQATRCWVIAASSRMPEWRVRPTAVRATA